LKKVARNSSFLIGSEIFSRIITFVLTVYIVRLLGAADYGRLSFAISLSLLFAVFSDLGINAIMIREISREKSEAGKYVGNMCVLRFLLSVVAWGLIFLTVNLMGYPENVTVLVYLIGCGIILNSFSEVFTSVFRAYEQMEFAAIVTIFQRVSPLMLGLLALLKGWGLLGVARGYLIVGIGGVFLSLIILLKRFVVPRIEIDFGFWKSVIMKAMPLGLALIFTVIYFRISILMLSKMQGDEAVGWFNAAYRLIESFMFVPIGLIGAFFPVFSALYVTSPKTLLDTSRKAIKILLLVVLPVAVGTSILADKIIQFLYGFEFLNSALPLRILIWAEVIIFVNYVLTQLLVATNRQRFNAIFTFVCSIFNVVLNFILIPRLSYIGAGISTLATEGLLFVMCFYLVRKTLGVISLLKICRGPLLASILMGVVVIFFREQSLFISVPLGVVTYGILVYVLGVFRFKSL
jgi:O-antigen/teichoic acid export membrane protein